jgi:hypothetical protein
MTELQLLMSIQEPPHDGLNMVILVGEEWSGFTGVMDLGVERDELMNVVVMDSITMPFSALEASPFLRLDYASRTYSGMFKDLKLAHPGFSHGDEVTAVFFFVPAWAVVILESEPEG